MNNIRIISSNSWEKLLESFADVTDKDFQGKLFAPINVVVRNSANRNALVDGLTRLTGFVGNMKFYLPGEFTRIYLGEDDFQVSRDISLMMTFHFMEIFRVQDNFEHFFSSASNIGQDPEKLFVLSKKIGDLFMKSLDFNPDLFLRESLPHPKADWLWNRFLSAKNFEMTHEKLLRTRDQPNTTPPPKKLYYFGFPFLSGLEMIIFQELLKSTQITFFTQQPTQEFWSSNSKRSVLINQNEGDGKSIGNYLLRCFGQAGRQFQKKVLDNNLGDNIADLYQEPSQSSLLNNIRSLMLNDINFIEPVTIDADDDSLQIHSCSSTFREVQVLYSQLVHALKNNPDLTPDNMIVSAPDIQTYLPHINAVFSDNPHQIPFHISEHNMLANSDIFAFIKLMFTLPSIEFGKATLINIMEMRFVRDKFRLSSEDAELLAQWLEGMNITNTSLLEQKENHGERYFDYEGSWHQIKDRLVLGHVMHNSEHGMFEGIIPNSDAGGLNGELLGKFLKLLNSLLEILSSSRSVDSLCRDADRDLKGWSEYLKRLSDIFISEEEKLSKDFEDIIHRLDFMSGQTPELLFDKKTLFKIIDQLAGEYRSFSGFAGSGVRFSSLVPIRGVSEEFIYVLGMDKNDFPKQDAFKDNIFDNAFYCEPDIKDNQLYCIMELLLNARRSLHFSYVGYDSEQQYDIPPSSVVINISEYIRRHFQSDSTNEDWPVINHPMNDCDPNNFTGNPDLWTYIPNSFQQAKILNEGASVAPNVFWGKGSGVDAEPPENISLDNLIEFYSHPVRYFCKRSLGIEDPLPYSKSIGVNLEPTAPSTEITKFILKRSLGESNKNQSDTDPMRQFLSAGGDFPRGSLGDYYLDVATDSVKAFNKISSMAPPANELSEQMVIFTEGKIPLFGRINPANSGVMPEFAFDNINHPKMTAFYLKHLLTACFQPDYTSCLLVGLKYGDFNISNYYLLKLNPIVDPQETLARLIDQYIEGLKKPLHLFPSASRELILGLIPKFDAEQGLQSEEVNKLTNKLEPGWSGLSWGDRRSEGKDDFFISRIMGGKDIGESDFAASFYEFYSPLFNSLDLTPAPNL